MSPPRVAICIVTFNSADLIADLVSSIPSGAAGTRATVVFADNASSDDTVAQIRAHAPDAVVVETGGNLGYSGGVNVAMRAAGDQDAYLILNADVRLTEGCVATMFATLTPRVGIVVPRLIDARSEIIWSIRREPSLLRAWADALIGAERSGRIGRLGEIVTDPAEYREPHDVDWAEGSTQLVGAACARVCGPWDESFFLYSEETDYDLRARDAGFAVRYQPAAVARHLEGGSAGSPSQWSLLVMNRVRLYARRHGRIRSALFWLAVLVREGLRAARGRQTSRAAVRDLVRPARWRERPGPAWLARVRVHSQE